jgi:hypothetical protein
MAPVKSDQPKRLQMLGTASLLALLIGGLILILVGVNALINYSTPRQPDDPREPYIPVDYDKSIIQGQAAMKVGREWGIQTWIAITGVAFGLLSFGFAEAYMQIFDSWSSRQAQRGSGLDYARYLNSQPRAPVLYGIRGFPAFVTLKYIIIIMGIAASIGYKFAFVTPTVRVIENIDHRTIKFTGHRLGMVYNNNKNEFSDTTPWITDFPLYNISRSFAHFYQRVNDSVSGVRTDLPPNMLIMSGHASCVSYSGPYFKYGESGNIITRELALVANGSVPKGEFTMTEDKGEWERIEISNSTIFKPPQKAIIEYRMSRFAELQIQWAKAPEDLSGTWEVPVVNRSQYNIDMAVVQVVRVVKNLDCKTMAGGGGDGVSIRALNNKGSFMNFLQTRWKPHIEKESIEGELMNVTRKTPEFSGWLELLVKDPDTTLLTAVSAIIRAIMVCHEEGPGNTQLLFDERRPFGEERDPYSDMFPGSSDNFFVGYRVGKYVGCYVSAAVVFVVLGCITILVAVFRVWLGPPALTSWMGQHMYLAHTEAISLSGKAVGLASGYQVAERDLGRLRLYTQKSEEADTMLKQDRGAESEGQSSKERDSENRGIMAHKDDTGMREREREIPRY